MLKLLFKKKTGSKVFQIVVLRITGSFAGAFLLHWLLPAINEPVTTHTLSNQNSSLPEILEIWLNGSFWLSIKVILIVVGLLFLQKVLDEFGVMNILSKIFKPLMKPMGLSENTSFHWLIANAIGLTYGSAVLIEQVETQKITPKEADLLNQHIAINHSMLEDTLLFVAIGVSAFWITFPRIAIAIAAVWIYRFLKR